MKKLFFAITFCLTLSAGLYAASNVISNTPTPNTNGVNEKYEYLKRIQNPLKIDVRTGEKTKLGGHCVDFYRGVNTCDSYYAKIVTYDSYSEYCPVYKNTANTYKGIDVSDYNRYVQYGNVRYFFFY